MTVKALYDKFLSGAGVSTDSRSIAPGAIFFALRGDNFDGNRYAADALAKGASYAVVDDPGAAVSGRYILVDDALSSLQELAAHHRNETGATIIAITGTNGKTTTKELVSRVLGSRYRVSATEGNLNNHIGVPLTLLRMRRGDTGVVEMGANAPGEIGALCRIARPDYGIITNIGKAHLEGFGGPDGVKAAKGELYDWLCGAGGAAFVNADDPVLCGMAAERPAMKKIFYGNSTGDGYRSRLTGSYNLQNISAAVAVGEHFGVPAQDIRLAIEGYLPANNRSQTVDTGRNTVIADCYNANPSSMRAALTDFARMELPLPKIAVLGDMSELGTYSETEHVNVLKLLSELGLREAWLVGGNFSGAGRKYSGFSDGMEVRFFRDTDSLCRHLQAGPPAGRLVLLKGSRSMRMERALDLL